MAVMWVPTAYMILEFLRGTSTSDECEPIFKQYEKCLSVSDG
jgi:hypothetical protein